MSSPKTEAFIPAEAIRELVTRSSVKLSVSTRGVYTWEIKVYDEDVEFAADEVRRINKELVATYGIPGGAE